MQTDDGQIFVKDVECADQNETRNKLVCHFNFYRENSSKIGVMKRLSFKGGGEGGLHILN